MNIRVDSILPILSTASGRVFAAFMPGELTAPLVEVEQRRAPRFRDPKIVEEARQRGFAAVEGTLVPGVSAVSVPVFDHNNKIAGVIGALGRSEEIDTAAEGKVTKALLRGAAEISWRMGRLATENAGARPDAPAPSRA